MFIHIEPEETETLRRISRKLLFPAPGMPKGHVLMGYDDQGQCHMLKGGECSIYEDRPQTCRDYDCRIFAATGVAVDQETQQEIARRVAEWVFSYESGEGREEHGIVEQAAAFLQNNHDLFPPGVLPNYPVQLAALAVRLHMLFAELQAKARGDAACRSDAAMAQAILSELRERETAAHLAQG